MVPNKKAAAGKAKPKAAPAGNDPVPSPRKEEDEHKKKLAELLKNSLRVKGLYITTTQRAEGILGEVKLDGKYQWARGNPKGDQLISDKLSDIRDGLSEFLREYLVASDLRALKKKYDDSRVVVELSEFVQYEDKIKNLASVLDAMVSASDLMGRIG